MGGALGDHALPCAYGRIDVLFFVQVGKKVVAVKQRVQTQFEFKRHGRARSPSAPQNVKQKESRERESGAVKKMTELPSDAA